MEEIKQYNTIQNSTRYYQCIHNGMFSIYNSYFFFLLSFFSRQHTMSKLSRAVKFIMGVWIVAFAFAIPQAIQFDVVSIDGGHSCTVSGLFFVIAYFRNEVRSSFLVLIWFFGFYVQQTE